MAEEKVSHLGLLDDMDHEVYIASNSEYRESELRIQALGAAISRRDWHAAEQAYNAIRDKFYSHSIKPPAAPSISKSAAPSDDDDRDPMDESNWFEDPDMGAR